jgi:hypothetical protein
VAFVCTCLDISRSSASTRSTLSVMVLFKKEVLGSWTAAPWTFNFRHLLPSNRHWAKRFSFKESALKSVRPRDRIKYWNIVPGDQVRIIGQQEGTIYEVLAINRFRNLVGLKVPSTVCPCIVPVFKF